MKRFYKKYIGPLYFTNRFYAAWTLCATLFVLRFFLIWLGDIPFIFSLVIIVFSLMDYVQLFMKKESLFATRTHAERLSNGNENEIRIDIENRYPFTVFLEVIDEVPFQFQRRDILFTLVLNKFENKFILYHLRPVKRGAYEFGFINVFAATQLKLIRRRYKLDKAKSVKVYPSYLQLRKYQLLAISNRLSETGLKKIRRIGHSMEFEQIKEYVPGDDYRVVNWTATARRGNLMVNNFTDEKSQQIYCIIDKGRVMKMPFNGLSLLDYAINTALVLSNVALIKQDKAGIITFAEKINSFLPAEKKALQMQNVLELLYNQKTRYLESDFEKLFILLRRKVSQRSLIVLFTNFESLNAMKRQLPYLKKIAENHLLLVVFFENSEIDSLLKTSANNVEDVYTKAIAEKFAYEKKQIVKELKQHGILSILTSPQNLTVNTLNKYLEIKARQML